MSSLDIENDAELDSQTLNPSKKHDRKPRGDDPLSD